MGATERILYRRAIKAWGRAFQLLMLAEECCECSLAVHRLLRDRCSEAELAEEMADALIMIEQVSEMLPRGLLTSFKRLKLERLEAHLNEADRRARTKDDDNAD